MIGSTTPLHLRLLRRMLERGPRGTYRIASSLRAPRRPFIASIARGLGHARFRCDMADEISREVCVTGMYEPPVSRVFQAHVRPGASVVDVGANWGYFSLVAAGLAGPAGRVLALEPDPRHAERLRDNFILNGFAHAVVMQAAAAAEPGPATLIGYTEADTNRGVSRLSNQGEGSFRFDVQCVTIDAVTSGWPRVDLVKIDVEGAEADVLAGMSAGLASRRYKAVVLELHPSLLQERGTNPQACLDVLRGAGYRGSTIDMSPRTYRRALSSASAAGTVLQPLQRALDTAWPHLLWLAPDQPA